LLVPQNPDKQSPGTSQSPSPSAHLDPSALGHASKLEADAEAPVIFPNTAESAALFALFVNKLSVVDCGTVT